MKVSKVVELHTTLKDIGSAETPMRMTTARNLLLTTAVFDTFVAARDSKFQELVRIDESGNAVLIKSVQDALNDGSLTSGNGLPFGAYEYEEAEGLSTMIDYLEELKAEEVDLELTPISMSKLIRIKKTDKEVELVPLADLLEAADSKITSNALSLLLEVGLLVD